MHCILVNHSYVNEIQTITQLFFPNARFSFSFIAKNTEAEKEIEAAIEAAIEPAIEATIETTIETTYAVLSIIANNSVCIGAVYKDAVRLAVHSLPYPHMSEPIVHSLPQVSEPVSHSSSPTPTPDLPLSVKRRLMLALFHALKQVFDAYTPWGALTGIRPSKLVRQWLADGQTDRQIITALTRAYQCHEDKAQLAVTVAHTENRLNRLIVETAARVAPGKIPMGLYVSVPFCPSRCSYCSFNTMHKPVDSEQQAAYLAALAAECTVKARTMAEANGVITAVYIGGGTPTVLSEALLASLLEIVATHFGPYMCTQSTHLQAIRAHPEHLKYPEHPEHPEHAKYPEHPEHPKYPEYTVEAGRPDSLTLPKLRLLKDYGVNRIAVNPQTLQDRTLAAIGRNHTARDFFAAFDMARQAGFDRINTDVIAGLPGEGPADMAHTMAALAALSPENITVHTLAVKRASRLNEHLADYVPPGDTVIEKMLSIAQETCITAGLHPYYLYRQKNMVGLLENVGYSKPGCECLYNISMMAETQTVLAVGAGAVSKFVNGTLITRSFNVKNADIYVARTDTASIDKI